MVSKALFLFHLYTNCKIYGAWAGHLKSASEQHTARKPRVGQHWSRPCNAVSALRFRLQNGVEGVSHVQLVTRSLD